PMPASTPPTPDRARAARRAPAKPQAPAPQTPPPAPPHAPTPPPIPATPTTATPKTSSWEVVEQRRAAEPTHQGPTPEDKSYAEWFAWAKRSGAPAGACHAAAQEIGRASCRERV